MFEVNRLHKLLGIRSSRTNRWKCVRSALSKQGVAFVRVQGGIDVIIIFQFYGQSPLTFTDMSACLRATQLFLLSVSSFSAVYHPRAQSHFLLFFPHIFSSFSFTHPPTNVAMNLHSPLNSLPSLAIDVHSNIFIFYATIVLGLVSHQQPPRPLPTYETIFLFVLFFAFDFLLFVFSSFEERRPFVATEMNVRPFFDPVSLI